MSVENDDLEDGLEYSFDASEDEGVAIKSDGVGEGEAEGGQGDDVVEETNETKPSKIESDGGKKRKTHEKDKLKAKKRQRLEYDVAEKRKLATETPDVIAERLATKVKSQNSDLSSLELAELYVNKSFIQNTGDWGEKRSLVNLPKFLENYIEDSVLARIPSKQKKDKKKSKKSKKKKNGGDGRFFAVILSMSAIRACDVHRATRSMEAGSLKLISKNKMKDDIKNLRSTDMRILAATPGRLLRILEGEESPLKESEIKAVICDCYMDPKMQTVWDSKDTIKTLRKIADGNEHVHIYLY
ncbi:DEKNAAC100347 [Brettanomyces naardenensis]|uniref:DEKNAAC100347 n=1 Tax=Brettanomyces naardenensis TaxID=13370 RepID=A0A448YEQ7_BRENA|nr:DEKNAAC100347 [Brettanomyces naardenensis]